jgi:Nif-specific regulatory protein
MVDEGKFRQDLFFRLNVFSLHVPPLRARMEDIDVLAEFFLEQSRERLNKRVEGFRSEVIECFRRYEWPGNVRELQNEVERLVILVESGELISVDLVSERVRLGQARAGRGQDLKEQLGLLERELILKALRAHGNNKTQAAEALGITRQTIISKLKQYAGR